MAITKFQSPAGKIAKGLVKAGKAIATKGNKSVLTGGMTKSYSPTKLIVPTITVPQISKVDTYRIPGIPIMPAPVDYGELFKDYFKTTKKPLGKTEVTIEDFNDFVNSLPYEEHSTFVDNYRNSIDDLVKANTYHPALGTGDIFKEFNFMGMPETEPVYLSKQDILDYYRTDALPRVLQNLKDAGVNLTPEQEEYITNMYSDPFSSIDSKVGYTMPGSGGYSLGPSKIRYSNKAYTDSIDPKVTVHEIHHNLRNRLGEYLKSQGFDINPNPKIDIYKNPFAQPLWRPPMELLNTSTDLVENAARNNGIRGQYTPQEIELMRPLAMTSRNSEDKTPIAEIGAVSAGNGRFGIWQKLKSQLPEGQLPTIQQVDDLINKMSQFEVIDYYTDLPYGFQIAGKKRNDFQQWSNDLFDHDEKTLGFIAEDTSAIYKNRLDEYQKSLSDAYKKAMIGIGILGVPMVLNYNQSYKKGGILKGQSGLQEVPAQRDATRVAQHPNSPKPEVESSPVDKSWENNTDNLKYNPYNDKYVREFFDYDVLPRYMRENPNATQEQIEAVKNAYIDPQKSFYDEGRKIDHAKGGFATNVTHGWMFGIPLHAFDKKFATYNSKFKLSRPLLVHENTHLYRQGDLGYKMNDPYPFVQLLPPFYGVNAYSGYNSKEGKYLLDTYDLTNYDEFKKYNDNNLKYKNVVEAGATNAEVRYRLWKELYDKTGKRPTIDELDDYIKNYSGDELWYKVLDSNGYGEKAFQNMFEDYYYNIINPNKEVLSPDESDRRWEIYKSEIKQRELEWDNKLKDALIHVADNNSNNQLPENTDFAKRGGVIKGQRGMFISPLTNKITRKLINFINENIRKKPEEQKAVGPAVWAYNKPTIIGKRGGIV